MPRLTLKQKDRILLLDFNRIRKISNKFKMVEVNAWSYHMEVEDNWKVLESNIGDPAPIEGKMYLERAFLIQHRDG